MDILISYYNIWDDLLAWVLAVTIQAISLMEVPHELFAYIWKKVSTDLYIIVLFNKGLVFCIDCLHCM